MARRAAERTVPRSEPEAFLFMEGIDVSRHEALRPLPVTNGTITSPKRATGIIFHESSLTAVISALKETRDFERVPTENPNVTYLKFPEVFRVTTDRDWRSKEEFVKAAEKILLPVINKNISISFAGGSPRDPEEDGQFYICLFSTAKWKNRDTVRIPKELWGIPTDNCSSASFPPSGLGEPILAPCGYCAGELVGNNLYIHYEINCHRQRDGYPAFEKILEEVVIFFSIPESEREQLRREKTRAAEQLRREKTRAAYVDMCTRRFGIVLKETEKKIEKSAKEMEELQIKIVRTIREAEGLKKKLEQLRKSTPDLEAYGKEFDKLFQVPHVIDVKVSENIINVFYDDIRVEHAEKNYLLGKYRMDIFYDGTKGCLRFENLTKKWEGCDHPHVRETQPCLGTIAESIATLIAEHQYSVIAILGAQFLKSYNPADKFVPIERWGV